MIQTDLPQNVQIIVQRDMTGQIVFGNGNLVVGPNFGGVINQILPDQRPKIEPLATPVSLRPRAFSGFLDREAETDQVQTALRTSTSVEFCGQEGIGKTVLLKHIAHSPLTASFLDGVVYRSARHQFKSDVLQSLFDAFYQL